MFVTVHSNVMYVGACVCVVCSTVWFVALGYDLQADAFVRYHPGAGDAGKCVTAVVHRACEREPVCARAFRRQCAHQHAMLLSMESSANFNFDNKGVSVCCVQCASSMRARRLRSDRVD
jgi:hypothetical protein